MPPCDVCKDRERAYCCPACGVKTCSLACCKAHKAQVSEQASERAWPLPSITFVTCDSIVYGLLMSQQTGCTGRRARFSYMSLSQFTDAQLRSGTHSSKSLDYLDGLARSHIHICPCIDYFFLEEVINSTQAAKRKLHKAGGAGSGNRGACHGGGGGQHPSRRQRKRGRGPQGPPQQPQQQPQLPAGLVPSMGGASGVVDALAARAQRAMGLGEGPQWLLRYPPGPQRLVAEVGRSHIARSISLLGL